MPSSSSLSTSPLPPSSTSPNPAMHPRLQQHGHSMSMVQAAHAPVFQPTMFKPSGFNMFGFPVPVAHDGDNPRVNSASPISIYAPQGRAPVHLSVPQTPSRAESRPDFVRGFGLDIPEEEEPEEPPRVPDTSVFESLTFVEQEQPTHDESAAAVTSEPQATDAQSIEEVKPTVHTRHTSRISVALSIGSTRQMEAVVKNEDIDVQIQEEENVDTLHQQATAESDAVDDWTGSEDVHSVRGSDDGVRLFFHQLQLCPNRSVVRALVNGPILRTKNAPDKPECNVACAVVFSRPNFLAKFQISRDLRKTATSTQCQMTRSSQIRATKRKDRLRCASLVCPARYFMNILICLLRVQASKWDDRCRRCPIHVTILGTGLTTAMLGPNRGLVQKCTTTLCRDPTRVRIKRRAAFPPRRIH